MTAAVLTDRLNTGWVMCQQEADPAKRERLEDYWVALLREYELQCRLEELAPPERMDIAS